MVATAQKVNKIKKRNKKFLRHHADRFERLGKKWRKPRGIDNRMRRRYQGSAPMPVIGFGTNKKHKFLRPNGFYTFAVHNVEELELLLMHNKSYAAEIAGNVSVRKRKEILDRAAQLDIYVTNPNARLRHEE